MEIRDQNNRIKIHSLMTIRFLSCALCLVFCVLFTSVLYAQSEDEGESEEETGIQLPSVKIEVVDITRLDIPREKFQSFMKPDPAVYAPMTPKERSWHAPSSLNPEKYRATPDKLKSESLFSATAQFGVPQALAYQVLFSKGFGYSEALLDVGRANLWEERTPEYVDDSSKELSDFTIDKLRGSLAHQVQNSDLKVNIQYDGRKLGYLDDSGEESPNDRALIGLSGVWDQRLANNVSTSLNLDMSNLKMTGIPSSGDESGLKLGADFNVAMPWPGTNPIDMGAGIKYFSNEVEETDSSPASDLKETILSLFIRDKHIRLQPFILAIGAEFILDSRSFTDAESETGIYIDPSLVLTTQLGDGATFQLGIERNVLEQDFNSLYMDKDYVQFNPNLALQDSREANAILKFKLAPTFTAKIEGFGKEIRNMTIFEETDTNILSWTPGIIKKTRIYGVSSGWKLTLMDGKIEHILEYTHEEHDQNIPYRANDSAYTAISLFAPLGIELSLSGEFYGARYVKIDEADGDGEDMETLSSFFLLKPRISKTFGKYLTLFVMAELFIGDGDYQIWKGYKLPDQTVDFGLTLKF